VADPVTTMTTMTTTTWRRLSLWWPADEEAGGGETGQRHQGLWSMMTMMTMMVAPMDPPDHLWKLARWKMEKSRQCEKSPYRASEMMSPESDP
jgi:hypothetical protein